MWSITSLIQILGNASRETLSNCVIDESLFCSIREREQLTECLFLQGRIPILSLYH